MKIDFRKMMAQGVEWYDPKSQEWVTAGKKDPAYPSYHFFTDNKTGLRVSYTMEPSVFGIRQVRRADGGAWGHYSKQLYRAIVNRFLETFPSSLPHARMTALHSFVEEFKYANTDSLNVMSACHDFLTAYSKFFGLYPYTRFPGRGIEPSNFLLYHPTQWSKREDRFLPRYRMFRRTEKCRIPHANWKLDSFVNAWHQSCGSLGRNGPPAHTDRKAGWTYDWDKKEIGIYNTDGLKTKGISLAQVDIANSNLVPVYGINNCFCGILEEKIGETTCIRLLNRNLNLYGYICTDQHLEAIQTVLRKPLGIFTNGDGSTYVRARVRCEDMIGSTKPKALALFLAHS